MKKLSEMTDAELLGLLPEKPKEEPAKEPEKETVAEQKTEQTINVVVEIKPEDFQPKVDPAKTTEAKLIFKLMDEIQAINERMAVTPEKPEQQDKTLLEMINSVKNTQEYLLKKREWHFDIVRNNVGDVSEIVAREI
jgi:hypothetical protein